MSPWVVEYILVVRLFKNGRVQGTRNHEELGVLFRAPG